MNRLPIILLALLPLACSEAPDPAPNPGPEATATDMVAGADEIWDQFIDHVIEGYFEHYPTQAVDAGDHRFDGQLPDFSPQGIENTARWWRQQQLTAQAFDPNALDATRRFEREYLLARIDNALFWLVEAEWWRRSPTFYLWSMSPSIYLTREYAPLRERMVAYVDFLENLPAVVEQMKANLRTPLPATYVYLAARATGGFADYFENDVPGIFETAGDEALQARFAETTANAVAVMRDLSAWFDAQQAEATDDYALGPELFKRMLWATERVDVPLERLKLIGEADLHRNLSALADACAGFARDLSITDCVAKAQANKPEGGSVEGARRQLPALKQFLIDEDLVSIPGTEEALVAEAPPYQRFNFAYIEIPGPLEKGLASVYYIAPPDPSWSEEVQLAYIAGRKSLQALSVNAVWPGHFLSFLHANRSDRMFGRLFGGYAFAEGWAHYTEEMMVEAGLDDDSPETHIGQLLNALLRNVRFLSAIGLHTEGMTVEESEKMFLEQAFQDPRNARQQAARGTFDPGYLNYTLGKLMIRELRKDWTASRGEREAWKKFHDTFLSYGGPPIPLVREDMLGPDAGDAL